ncbi:hypothetical protein OG21DRAFT_1256142 [Imleria badia]|nr:hypothetical protein OG21DRAFT_1256142 [Imleria badia]
MVHFTSHPHSFTTSLPLFAPGTHAAHKIRGAVESHIRRVIEALETALCSWDQTLIAHTALKELIGPRLSMTDPHHDRRSIRHPFCSTSASEGCWRTLDIDPDPLVSRGPAAGTSVLDRASRSYRIFSNGGSANVVVLACRCLAPDAP